MKCHICAWWLRPLNLSSLTNQPPKTNHPKLSGLKPFHPKGALGLIFIGKLALSVVFPGLDCSGSSFHQKRPKRNTLRSVGGLEISPPTNPWNWSFPHPMDYWPAEPELPCHWWTAPGGCSKSTNKRPNSPFREAQDFGQINRPIINPSATLWKAGQKLPAVILGDDPGVENNDQPPVT